ncbi:MAG: radical SAM protein [Candidatus Omnitrophica bacterium]|nr:radical SAM protein [Candidatus Omnitrophota bacterium]
MNKPFDSDKPFYSLLKKEHEKNINITKPLFCDLLISEKCNLKCKTCYFWKYGLDDKLTIEECKDFILSLKDIAKIPFEINLGGGEPLLNKWILELVRYCVEQGLQPAISTNATLIDEEMAKKISDAGLHRLGISLEGINEETHDFLTGTKGAYSRLMKAIEYLKKYWKQGDLNIHTIILEQNIDEIIALAEWVNKDSLFTGIAFQALAQPFRTNIKEKWYLEDEHSSLWPKDFAKVCSILDTLIEYKLSGYRILNPIPQLIIYKRYYTNPDAFARIYKCNFGNYIFNVNALGLVHLCCFMDPIGNVKKNKIYDMWHSEEANKTRAAMYNCQKSCNNIVNCYFQEEGNEIKNELYSRKAGKLSKEIISCDLLLTASCMLGCKMCYLWKRPKDSGELEIEEWKGLVNSLSEFITIKPMRLHFGGGEPFLKKGTLDLVKYSVQEGFKTIITSNGFLVDGKMADEISESGLSHITFSLDSLRQSVHDYLRGKNGSHASVLKAIDYIDILQKKPTIGINCLISSINLDDILPLAHSVINDKRISGVIFQAVVQPYETPLDDEWYKKDKFNELWPNDIKKVEYVLDQLIDLKIKGNYKISNSPAQLKAFKMYFRNPLEFIKKTSCPMDDSSLIINWLGQVFFCGMLQNIGNIREHSIEEILLSKTAKDRQHEMQLCNKNCNNKVNCFFKEEIIDCGK